MARAGHRVTLVERFATPAPLGSGLMLQPTGLAVLARLGLDHDILSMGRRIERMVGHCVPSGTRVLDVGYAAMGAGFFGLAVHRAALFRVLYDAVQREPIELVTGFDIVDLDRAHGGRPVLTAGDGRRIGPFDLVVDATGGRSMLARQCPASSRPRDLAYGAVWADLAWPDQADFDRHTLAQRYRAARTMIGVLPIGRREPGGDDRAAFFWSLKTEDHAAWRLRGLDAWKDEVHAAWPETAPFLDQIEEPGQLILASYRHHTVARPYVERLVVIGDAAHATSPQLGQGANMGLLDAAALAVALACPGDLQERLVSYHRLRRRHVKLYQAMSVIFTPFYQSDSRSLPILRDIAIPALTRLPLAGRLLAFLVAGLVGQPLRSLGLEPYRATHVAAEADAMSGAVA